MLLKTAFRLALASQIAGAFTNAQDVSVQIPVSAIEPASFSKLLSFHKSLVNIESITGNEHDVGKYLARFLHDHNLTVEIQSVDEEVVRSPAYTLGLDSEGDFENALSDLPKRFNVFAYPGDRRETKVLITSHIDTVPPFYPYHINHTSASLSPPSHALISGRGSVDAKACVAAQSMAFLDLMKSSSLSPGDAALLFVVGEEKGGTGMHAANALNLTWSSVLFGEPTEHALVTGHKGIAMMKLQAHGKGVHSGYPELGASANEILITALAAVERLSRSGLLPSSEKYGNTTVNFGRIEGGVAANVVPEAASADVALRLAAGTMPQIKNQLVEAVLDATQPLLDEVKGKGSLHMQFGQGYGPVDIDADIEGFKKITVNYGTDVPNLDGNHKRYLYGPGSILVAHSDHEALTVGALQRGYEDYRRIISTLLERE